MANSIALSKDEAKWRAERDLETLMECERIEKDPKRLKAAKAIAKERMKDLETIKGESSKDES